MEEIKLKEDTKLDQLLKYVGFVSTGGEAKLAIKNGDVRINSNIEKKRGYKVKDGDIVTFKHTSIRVALHN